MPEPTASVPDTTHSPHATTGFHRVLTGQLEEIPELASGLSQWAQAAHIPARTIVSMNLMLDELITNIVCHGYARAGGMIDVQSDCKDDAWVVTLTDHAFAYDPLQATAPDTTLGLEDRDIGGLGVHFIRKLADALRYERLEVAGQGANRLHITKRLNP